MHLALSNAQYVSKLLASSLPNSIRRQSAVAVALSGGPDSTALAHLLHCQTLLPGQGGIKKVVALIVDHGLREDSKQEAEHVFQWTGKLGIPCEVRSIPWGIPPFPDLPSRAAIEASARTARLILFKRFLRQNGLRHIYLAHHLDDQVETAYLRQRRGTTSGLALPGLRTFSGIPLALDPAGPDDELLALVRPLLTITKAELVQYCHEHKLPYVVDPTNANPAYTSRNAFRFTLQDLQKRTGAVDQDSGPVCFFRRWASRLATRRARLEQRLKSLMTNVEKDAPVKTACMFDPARIRKMRSEVRKLFLSQVARQVSPATDNSSISPSSMEKLDEAIFGYRKARQSAVNRLTPGAGVMFTAKHVYGRKYWIVSRQPMRKLEHMEASYRLSDTDWHLWDNRFWCRSRLKDMARLPSPVIIKPEDPWTLPAVSVGQPEAADIETARKAAAGVSLSRVELASSPLGDQTVEIVEVGGRSSKTCAV